MKLDFCLYSTLRWLWIYFWKLVNSPSNLNWINRCSWVNGQRIYRRMCAVFKITEIKWKTRFDAIVFCFHIANAQLWLADSHQCLQKQRFHCSQQYLCILKNYPVSHGIASGRWICWWEYTKITNKMHLQCFCKKVLHSETFSFS